MSQDVKNQEMSDAEFSYESLRERKVADAQLYNLRKERGARHEREAQWDTMHRLGPIARWFVNEVRHFNDILDEDDIQEALATYNPMMGFSRWKALQTETC